MWDNRDSKRNPKQPDYKCKDKECGKAVWEQKKPANGGSSGKQDPAPSSRPRWSWKDLFAAHEACHKQAVKVLGEKAPHEAIQSATATLLIAAKDHQLPGPVSAKQAQAQEQAAEKQRLQQEYASGSDDDLPF